MSFYTTKNFFYYKKIYRIYIFLILGSFVMMILSACTTNNFNQNSRYCPINKVDDIKYLSYFNKNLSLLNIPQHLNILPPHSNLDYYIPPPIDLSIISNNINNITISICPPTICENIFNESCLIDID